MIEAVRLYAEENGLNESNRKREVVYRRGYLYTYLKKCGYGLSEIGNIFNKDHATVLHGIRKYAIDSHYEDVKLTVQDEMFNFPMSEANGLKKYETHINFRMNKSLDMYERFRNIDELILNK